MVEREYSAMIGQAGTSGRPGRRRDPGHVVGEEVQPFANGEPRIDERERIRRSECARDHARAPLFPQGLEAALNEFGRGGTVGAHGEVGDVVVAPPRSHADPTTPPSQRLLARHPVGASVHPPILTEGPCEAGSQR